MADVVYSAQPTSIPRFLDHMQSAGVPTKVTITYLESVGFKSKNDRPIIAILKKLGFLDSSATPTQVWRDYRDKTRARAVLGRAIRSAYKELFDTFPDAHRRDNEAVRNFFSTHSDLGDATLTYAVRTFKTLCDRAHFEAVPPKNGASEEAAALSVAAVTVPGRRAGQIEPSININIELHLPPTDDGSLYEKLFSAMGKHLFADGHRS